MNPAALRPSRKRLWAVAATAAALVALPFVVYANLASLLIILPALARLLFRRVTLWFVVATLAGGMTLDWLFHNPYPHFMLWLGLFVVFVRNAEEYVDFYHVVSPLFLAAGAFLWTALFDSAARLLVTREWRWEWDWSTGAVLLACAYFFWLAGGGYARWAAGPRPGGRP